MKKKGLGGWVTGALMIAGICYAASYSLPYIKGIFYDPMMKATGATNTQLGLIMSVYGFGNVIFNLIGGFVTDKLDYKKCIIVSLLGTTALSVWLALAPSVINMYIIWGLFGVTTFFVFNPSIFKLPRMIVPEHLVGESVGMFSFAQSIGYMVINFTSLYVYNLAEKSVGQVPAFSTVVWVYAGFTFVSALGCIFIFRKVEDVNTEGDENEKFTFSQLALVMKEPGLWMMIICGFCMFSTMATTSYFVPYFNDVFGVAVTFSGVLGVLNLYGGRLFSPILGKIATKTKYVSRMVIFGTSALIVFLICILLQKFRWGFWWQCLLLPESCVPYLPIFVWHCLRKQMLPDRPAVRQWVYTRLLLTRRICSSIPCLGSGWITMETEDMCLCLYILSFCWLSEEQVRLYFTEGVRRHGYLRKTE